MTELVNWENLVALLTLTSLEIVLGIDNIIFIAILTSKLPEKDRPRARRLGLGLAMITRILLLFSLAWIMKLTLDLFKIWGHGVSGKDLVLIIGGLFLVGKATFEIHDKLECADHKVNGSHQTGRFVMIIAQIVALDIVFSLDSVITALGMASEIKIMVAAVIAAVGVMMLAANKISNFVERHPSIKILALAFLILIGVMLVAEGFDQHINKGYIYFAMAFSLGVEMLNMRLRKSARKKSTIQKS